MTLTELDASLRRLGKAMRPPRYRFDLVRWNDRDELEHLPLIGTVNDIPPGWAITRRKPL
jgi:hypothetical protein